MDINNLLSLNGCGTGALYDSAFVTTKVNHMAARRATEYSQTYAWSVNFSNGNVNYYYKYGSYRVRAVVAF